MRAFAILVLLVSVTSADPKPPPLDPPHLEWSMTEDRAEAALTAAKITARHDERRGYFPDGSGAISHTTEPELHWKITNGRAEARFQWNDAAKAYVLDEVALYMDVSDARLAIELASLERKYGKPHKSTPQNRVWVRGGVWLVAIPTSTADPKTGLFSLSVQFRRDDQPAP